MMCEKKMLLLTKKLLLSVKITTKQKNMGKRNKNDTKKIYRHNIGTNKKKSKQLLVPQTKKGNNGVIKI